jgi:hypothetical protein
LIATILVVLLIGCKPAAGSRSSVLMQSPVVTPLSNAAPMIEQSSTLSSKVRTSEATVLAKVAAAGVQIADDKFFPTELVANKLYGIGKQASGQLALYEVDLKTGLTRQVGTARKDWGNMHASERYVVWDMTNSTGYEVHIYDLVLDQESVISSGGGPDVSGNIIVWNSVRKTDGKTVQNIYGRNMISGEEFPIITRPSAYPRISGQWMIYLDSIGPDTADIYAHNLTTEEDFKIGVMPTQGQRIGTVEWYPVISGKNIVWVSAQDNKLHHYNLDTRTDRLLPVPLSEEAALSMPRDLDLDGDILIYDQRGQMGYDLALDAAFPIPVIPAVPGKWTSSTPALVSGGRLVWQTQVDQMVNLYTADIIRNP